ncbi:hypothetical protein KPB05_37280 [Burkholderia gladioli]|uniref:hypothetical protein n=1 Tax=Burkholderia gladioli TaxID=28095 RepID=UPI00285FEC84|nr:hypothetical protein [Burkholderia gladioli]MDR8093112.1 hypothetical protein [Burkholderia gladioli]
MSRFEVVGVNDERDFCECCGRQRLKRVVWIRDTETDDVKHFGTTCATSPVKGFNLDTEIKRAISVFQSKEKAFNAAVYQIYKRHGGKHVPHPTKPYTWTPADPELYARCRDEQRACGIY